ncbi:universal stress protein (plasmid) [Bosea sp. F3-2]|uniref:universal stress protein n=1 Tax=Bosea sp. F3-2 TaxID=2599640 RepID=UPI0011EC9D86|nr:universal stress protein [Bosea sp. F3-2]QEL27192.1 universal stress protein [Bosea sp. F3-2]
MNPSSTTRNYASIMVCVGLSSHAENHVALAASLASRFGSLLIGIAAEEATLPYLEDGLATARPILVENARNAAMEDLAQAETNFRRGVGHLPDIEWRSNIQRPTEFIANQARAADLIIVARSSSGASHRMITIDAGDAVMELGRPVLIVPQNGRSILARRVIVAWKDTREARRAVLDALPFLQRAESVTVLSVGDDARDQSGEDVCAHLARHGITSRPMIRTSLSGSYADTIVDAALEDGSDLIVSGAYGHNRLREWIFGGVTGDLLADSPIPCLMSH